MSEYHVHNLVNKSYEYEGHSEKEVSTNMYQY